MRRGICVVVVVLSLFTQGCGRDIDKMRIQGTWVGTRGGKLSFYSDGTCELNGRQGKYVVLDNNRLKVTTKGMLWGENDEYVNYSFVDSRLRIKAKILGFEVSDDFTSQ